MWQRLAVNIRKAISESIDGTPNIRIDDLKEVYRFAQEQIIQSSRTVQTYTGFAVTINVALCSYFLKAWIDSGNLLFIGIATGLSSMVIGLWRYNNRSTDAHMISFYTDLLRYELTVSIPSYSGMQARLKNIVPNTKWVFEDNDLKLEEKLEVIGKLVNSNHMGWRQSRRLELFFAGVTFIMLILTGILTGCFLFTIDNTKWFYIPCFAGTILGFILVLYEIRNYQRPLKESLVKYEIKEVKRKR